MTNHDVTSEMPTEKSERLRVRVGGKSMASVDARGLVEAEAEAFHYAMQYREEGEVTVQRWFGTFWRRHVLFAAFPAHQRRVGHVSWMRAAVV